jgi:sugar phosphate isomerase/epimerase
MTDAPVNPLPPTPSWAVFTKPWPDLTVDQLARKVAGWGFSGIELPLRYGYQVEPAAAERELPAFAAKLAGHGLRIVSLAADTAERTFAACAAAGVPLIRIMLRVGEEGYPAAEAEARRLLDSAAELSGRYGVTVGVQPHMGRFVSDAAGLRALIADYPPERIAAVWDAGHDALSARHPEHGLDILAPHLRLVNLKNVILRRVNGPEASHAVWRHHWTSGRHGLADWPAVAEHLRERIGWSGPIVLCAEYADGDLVERLVPDDLAYARELFGDG